MKANIDFNELISNYTKNQDNDTFNKLYTELFSLDDWYIFCSCEDDGEIYPFSAKFKNGNWFMVFTDKEKLNDFNKQFIKKQNKNFICMSPSAAFFFLYHMKKFNIQGIKFNFGSVELESEFINLNTTYNYLKSCNFI